ncbi:MAG: hypothetical protein KGQ37_09465 [Hyphomicrobiales bacterium]|nr:hypothetical protein [Hyphomicrobiales bacterium]
MATEAPNWYVQKYIDTAVTVFQQKGMMLRNMCAQQTSIKADTVNWMVAGKGEATPLQRGGIGAAMNGAANTVSAVMADWQAADWTYEADMEKMTVDEQAVVAERAAKAIGRRSDLMVMNALNATAASLVDNSNQPFTLTQAMTMLVALEDQDVGFEGEAIFCGLPPLAWQQFMSYRQVSNSQWVGADGLPYVTGPRMKDWNGVRWFRSPLSYAPIPSANNYDIFMWAKRAVGYGTNYDLRATVTWENLYTGWFHNARFAATAKTLLPAGVVRGRCSSNSAITIN